MNQNEKFRVYWTNGKRDNRRYFSTVEAAGQFFSDKIKAAQHHDIVYVAISENSVTLAEWDLEDEDG